MGAVHPLEIDAAFFPWYMMQTAKVSLDKTLDFDMPRVRPGWLPKYLLKAINKGKTSNFSHFSLKESFVCLFFPRHLEICTYIPSCCCFLYLKPHDNSYLWRQDVNYSSSGYDLSWKVWFNLSLCYPQEIYRAFRFFYRIEHVLIIRNVLLSGGVRFEMLSLILLYWSCGILHKNKMNSGS